MHTLRRHGKRIAVVGTLTLLAGALGIWSSAIAQGGSQDFSQGFDVNYSDGSQSAEVQAAEETTKTLGSGQPTSWTSYYVQAWGPNGNVSAWSGWSGNPSTNPAGLISVAASAQHGQFNDTRLP